MYRGIAHPNPSYISKIYDLPSEWITFPLKIIEKWSNSNWWIWQSQQPFLMFVKVDPQPYNLGGFKDSKQFNIKGTQRLVYTHNVNLMTPSTELCKHRSTQIL